MLNRRDSSHMNKLADRYVKKRQLPCLQFCLIFRSRTRVVWEKTFETDEIVVFVRNNCCIWWPAFYITHGLSRPCCYIICNADLETWRHDIPVIFRMSAITSSYDGNNVQPVHRLTNMSKVIYLFNKACLFKYSPQTSVLSLPRPQSSASPDLSPQPPRTSVLSLPAPQSSASPDLSPQPSPDLSPQPSPDLSPQPPRTSVLSLPAPQSSAFSRPQSSAFPRPQSSASPDLSPQPSRTSVLSLLGPQSSASSDLRSQPPQTSVLGSGLYPRETALADRPASPPGVKHGHRWQGMN